MNASAPVASPLPTPLRGLSWALGVTLLALCTAAYWNSFSVPLLLDDVATIAENPSIRDLGSPQQVFSPPAKVGTGGRPIANLTFAVNYALHGPAVTGYHIGNLIIHGAAALVLFALVQLTLTRPLFPAALSAATCTWAAFFVAALWAFHPVQTQTVTYISQRTESLMGFFYLATLYAFARGALSGARTWFAAAVAACALGVATKEVMVTAPLMALLYDRTFLAGSFAGAWRARKRVYLALALTWALLALLLLDVRERGIAHEAISPWHYALTETRALTTYLRLAFWPAPLVFDYGPTLVEELSAVWPQATAVCLLLTITLILLRRHRVLGFAGAWFFVALAPTSSFVPVGAQPIAENRLYLPLAALVGAVVLSAAGRLRLPLLLASGTLLVLGAALGTHVRNRDYRTALSVWSDTVAKAPANPRAHAGLGAALLDQGEAARAIPSLQRAVQLDPLLSEAHNNLAMALLDVGRTDEAIAHFAAAVKIQPEIATTHYNFGNALLALGRTEEAMARHRQALSLRPAFPEAQCGLANALAAAGRFAESLPHYETALRLAPSFTPARFGLASALANSGRIADAIPHFEATLQVAPNSLDAHYNLGNAYLVLQRPVEAARHFEAVTRLKPDFAEAHLNLGNAHALAHRVPEAIASYRAALALDPNLAVARKNLEVVQRRAEPVPATNPR